MTSRSPQPPVAQKRPVEQSHHGITSSDEYAWLRADNWQEVMRDPAVLDAEIRAHLEAENDYTKAQLHQTEDLQSVLFSEMKGRIKEDDASPPAPDGPYAYYYDYVTGGQHPRYCRIARGGSDEKVLLDGDALAKGKDYFNLGGVAHSPDHELVAYGSDERGSEYYTLRVVSVAGGKLCDDLIDDTSGSAVWTADARHFFYTRLDENHRPSKVYLHALGTAQSEDVLIYEEEDPGFFVGVGTTQSRAFIEISAHDHETSEVYLIDSSNPRGEMRCVASRERGHEYQVEHNGDRLIILTNSGNSEDFRIVTTPLSAPGRENWSDLVAHKAGRLILTHVVYRDHMVRLEREDGLPRVVITEFFGGKEHDIAFDEEAYALGPSAGYEFDTATLRFTYSSMTTPAQVFDYDMVSRGRNLVKTQEVPSGHDPEDYVTRRVYATAEDGETVPVSLLYRRSTPLDGSAPLLLYGYGAYGISIPASFSTNCLSLVDRGFIYAVAHVRGGKDKGYRWYRLGKREYKTNSFSDFIDAAKFLVADGFTQSDRIVAHGGSAGGMLMGAIANLAPECFGGIIAEVPFVDVLNTMLDDTLPLTPPEWPEWGNPVESKTDYEQIASYSPYDNVSARDYPHIMAVAGLTDPRVTYWEPAKWVARLRDRRSNDRLLLLKTNMSAGHGGAAGRFDRLKEVALVYAFALAITGKTVASS